MFLINLSGRESIFEQIRLQIIKYIQSGILSPGDKLPSVRSLAQELSINPNTVMKAYQKLEEEGYIYTLNKKGVFVAEKISKVKEKDAYALIDELRKVGFRKSDLLKVIEKVYKEDKHVKN